MATLRRLEPLAWPSVFRVAIHSWSGTFEHPLIGVALINSLRAWSQPTEVQVQMHAALICGVQRSLHRCAPLRRPVLLDAVVDPSEEVTPQDLAIVKRPRVEGQEKGLGLQAESLPRCLASLGWPWQDAVALEEVACTILHIFVVTGHSVFGQLACPVVVQPGSPRSLHGIVMVCRQSLAESEPQLCHLRAGRSARQGLQANLSCQVIERSNSALAAGPPLSLSLRNSV